MEPAESEGELTVNWSSVLPQDVKKQLNAKSTAKKIQLVVSLILFLKLPFAPLLWYLFESDQPAVKQRAGTFLRTNGNSHPDSDAYFAPRKLFHLWHTRFDFCRKSVHELLVKPCAVRIAELESNKGITAKDLSIKLSKLTMKDVRELLHPGKLIHRYRELFPFTFDILLAFTASPNKYRRYNMDSKRDGTEAIPDKEDPLVQDYDEWDDDGLEDDETLGEEDKPWSSDWRSDPQWAGFARCPLHAIVIIFSMMLFVRNKSTNFLPLVLGLFLKIGGANSRIISVFSKVGVCVTDKTVERVKLRLSEDAVQLAVDYIASGKLFYIIFDNINLYLRKFEQTLRNKNYMIHATNACIVALPLANSALEKEAFDLEAARKLGVGRSQAGPEDIILTKEDSTRMKKSFRALIAQFIVTYLPGGRKRKDFASLRKQAEDLTPHDRPLDPVKTATFPFGVFDVNEGSRQGVLEMMESIQEKSGLSVDEFSEKARVVQGDWLTVNNLRLVKSERREDVSSMEKVEYAIPLGALFHHALNAVKMIVKVHKGDKVLDPASLSTHKELLGRTWDINSPEYAQGKSLIRHSLISRIIDLVMQFNLISSWSALCQWVPSFEQILLTTDWIVENFTSSRAAQSAQEFTDDFLTRSILFIRDALIFCEFESAVSFADPGRVLAVLKYWVYAFRGAGMHNYARECLEVLLKWKHELTSGQREAMERAWFINRWGLSGRWIAADLFIEHLNYWIKRVFNAQGSNLTVEYIRDKGSACVEVFNEIGRRVSNMVGDGDRSRRHKEVKFEQDVQALVENMTGKRIHLKTAGRIIEASLKMKANQSAAAANATASASKAKDESSITLPGERKSAVVDVMETGADLLHSGKFSEFIRSTVVDPKLGLPLTGGTARESLQEVAREHESTGSIDGGEGPESSPPGIGGLGGGLYD